MTTSDRVAALIVLLIVAVLITLSFVAIGVWREPTTKEEAQREHRNKGQ